MPDHIKGSSQLYNYVEFNELNELYITQKVTHMWICYGLNHYLHTNSLNNAVSFNNKPSTNSDCKVRGHSNSICIAQLVKLLFNYYLHIHVTCWGIMKFFLCATRDVKAIITDMAGKLRNFDILPFQYVCVS